MVHQNQSEDQVESQERSASPEPKKGRKAPVSRVTKKKAPAKKTRGKSSTPAPQKKKTYPKKGTASRNFQNKKKGNASSVDKYDKTSEEIVDESWKLFRNRYSLNFNLCKGCNDELYHDDEKFEFDGEKYTAKIPMCHKCVVSNMTMNTVYYMGFIKED